MRSNHANWFASFKIMMSCVSPGETYRYVSPFSASILFLFVSETLAQYEHYPSDKCTAMLKRSTMVIVFQAIRYFYNYLIVFINVQTI